MILPSITSSIQNKIKDAAHSNNYSGVLQSLAKVWTTVPRKLRNRYRIVLLFIAMLVVISIIKVIGIQ